MVINHLRHSCVTSDDTGMCEMVIVQDEGNIFQPSKSKNRKRLGMLYQDEGSDYPDYPQSFDIAVSPGVMGRTPKTNRNNKPRSKQEFQCKTIHWNDNCKTISETDKDDMFQEKEVVTSENGFGKKSEHVSALSERLEDLLNQPNNPFVQYAKFDGEGVEDTCPTKFIEVFLSFLPTEEERLSSINVTFVDTATVSDVIGLTLYKYVLKVKKPRYQNDVKAYSLHISEEDGELDLDFPALDDKELMSKFGFNHLAVVEKHKATKQPVLSKSSVEVKIHIPNNGYSVVKVESRNVKMKIVVQKLIKKRGLKRNIADFNLEKPGEEGQHVDLEQSLDSMGTLVFNLIGMGDKDKDMHLKTHRAQDEIMSLHYKSYQVFLIHRLTSTEVTLGIHGQMIEIDPVQQPKSGPKFWTKIKPMSLEVDTIAECEITDKKPGRSVFRIYYKKMDDFKHYEFETDTQRAQEIVRKIHNILKSVMFKHASVHEEFVARHKKKFK